MGRRDHRAEARRAGGVAEHRRQGQRRRGHLPPARRRQHPGDGPDRLRPRGSQGEDRGRPRRSRPPGEGRPRALQGASRGARARDRRLARRGRATRSALVSKSFKKGDKVRWKTSQGVTHGEVNRKLRSRTQVGGQEIAATKDDPRYLVLSAGALAAAASGGSARPWLAACAISDAVDLAATLIADGDQLPPKAKPGTVAAAGVFGAAAAALAAREG